jgi:hypothetical protein
MVRRHMVTTNAIVSRGAKRRRRATAVIVPPTFVRVIGNVAKA